MSTATGWPDGCHYPALAKRLDMTNMTQLTCSMYLPAIPFEFQKQMQINFKPGTCMIPVDYISYDDFAKVKLRVARVAHAEPIEGKTRIMRGRVDLGDNDVRDVIIGGAQYHTPDEMIGKTVVVVANLEPKKVAGIESGAMLLAADVDDKPFWLTAHGADEIPLGSPVK